MIAPLIEEMNARPGRLLNDDRGFTLVEILVVILIIGLLALIALPAFLSQRAKGEDTEAQLTVRTAATALATYETDHGTFAATEAELQEIEPALKQHWALRVNGDTSRYDITETSASGTEFTVTREASGATTRTCTRHGEGLCRAAANSAGDWW